MGTLIIHLYNELLINDLKSINSLDLIEIFIFDSKFRISESKDPDGIYKERIELLTEIYIEFK